MFYIACVIGNGVEFLGGDSRPLGASIEIDARNEGKGLVVVW